MKLQILCNLLIVVGSPPIWGVPLGQVDVSVQLRARPCQNHPSKSGVPTHTALLQTNPVSPLPYWYLLGETGVPICTSLLPPRGDLGSASCWAPLTPVEGNRGSRVPTSPSCPQQPHPASLMLGEVGTQLPHWAPLILGDGQHSCQLTLLFTASFNLIATGCVWRFSSLWGTGKSRGEEDLEYWLVLTHTALYSLNAVEGVEA